jgi:hypothetical protein
MATPVARPPLTHLDVADTEVATPSVPQSLNEQEDWLASLETADPSEVPVLIFASPEQAVFLRKPPAIRAAVPEDTTTRHAFGLLRKTTLAGAPVQ